MQERPRHVLVLDLSKSMLAPMADGTSRKIEVARAALAKILDEVRSQEALFGLVVFNSSASVFLDLTPSPPPAESIASKLIPAGKSAIWDAIALGAGLLSRGGPPRGNLVVVTDGWDNMSRRYTVYQPGEAPPSPQGPHDLAGFILPAGSQLRLQIIGIGAGVEKDKGVDAVRMNALIQAFGLRAQATNSHSTASYQEVLKPEDLYSQMVNAFVDLPFDDSFTFDALSSEDLATHAAKVAHALRESDKHSLVSALGSTKATSPAGAPVASSSMEFEVALSAQEGVPTHWKERYGPLGEVADACARKDWARARQVLDRHANQIQPLARCYWLARVSYALGNTDEASRHLTEAWIQAETLGPVEKAKIYRRLALLHAKISGDLEVQSMVEIFERAALTAHTRNPELEPQLEQLFERFLELRGTYAKIQDGGAIEHEKLVDEIFGLLQDARLKDRQREASIQGFLSFVEVALSEMR